MSKIIRNCEQNYLTLYQNYDIIIIHKSISKICLFFESVIGYLENLLRCKTPIVEKIRWATAEFTPTDMKPLFTILEIVRKFLNEVGTFTFVNSAINVHINSHKG